MIARSALALAVLLLVPAPGASPQETGEARLSVDVREGDLHALLQVLARVGQFQVVTDPDVSCRLTLAVQRLPWDVVLEQLLRACGLGQEADGDLVRVAPVERLAAEQRERRELAGQRGETRDPQVRRYRLSYARAQELAPVLEALMPGSQVVYDSRTNTLFVVDR